MGLTDSFSNLFKTKAEREKEIRRRQRRAFTKAEDAIDTVNASIAEMTNDKRKAWEEAKKAAAVGNKAAAMLSLQKYRASEVMIYQLEKRKWVFQNYITRLKMLDVNNVFASAMNALTDVINVDVDAVIESVEGIDDKLADGKELDKIWESQFSKEMNGVSVKDTDIIPDVDTLLNSLQSEVALDIGVSPLTTSTSKTKEEGISEVKGKMDELLKETETK